MKVKQGRKQESPDSISSTPRNRQTGQVELLLQYVEKLTGRTLSKYDSRLLLTIVDSIIAELKEDFDDVSG